MTELDLQKSQLREILSIAIGRPSRNGSGPRVLFLPWFSFDETESRNKLIALTESLKLPLLFVPSHYSATQDANALRGLAGACCDPAASSKLQDAIRELPYSAALESEIVDRIADEIRNRKQPARLAIAALRAGPDADMAVSKMLDRAAQVGLKCVLVFAHKRPRGLVETVELPLRLFRKDICQLVPAAAKPPVMAGANEGARLPRSRKGFYEKLLDFFQRKSDAPSEPEEETVADWADLLTRLSQSNWGIAANIAGEWERLEKLIDAHFAELEREEHLSPDNVEERDAFELRLRFITILRVLYPAVFDAAALELDGADQLYRVLLILCGQSHGDSMVVGHLLPFWQQQLDDPIFQELCFACFNEIGRDRSLVPRIESRAQLFRLLALIRENEDGAGARPSSSALDALIKAHVQWVRGLSVSASLDGGSVAELSRQAESIANFEPTASEALQAAQIMMSAYELLPETGADKEKFGDLQDRLFNLVERLTRVAINQSRGAIRLDAALLRARANAVKGDADEGLDILRILRRTVREPLTRCAVDIEEAFIHERAGDLLKATHMYEDSLVAAERMGADELVARAASGCLRCDAVGFAGDPDLVTTIRARIVVEIQSARAPELFPMTKRDKPMLFISYRRESAEITKALVSGLNSPESILATWTDQELQKGEYFNARLHQRLHDSDAIVLLLSPNYFDSAWCVHELHFALGQNQLRGIPIYWAWCGNDGDGGKPCELMARDAFNAYVEDLYGHRNATDLESQRLARLRHQQAHITERLNLLFARGRLLTPEAIRYSSDPAAAVHPLIGALNGCADFLYRRARLKRPSRLIHLRYQPTPSPIEDVPPPPMTGINPQGASPCLQ